MLNWLSTWGPFLESPENLSGPKSICEIAYRLFWKADLLTCFQGNKKKINYEVWRIKCSPFLSYKRNRETRKWPVKFRDFRETTPRLAGLLEEWLALTSVKYHGNL